MKVKRTERGWPGHFIGAMDCLFRRNTLLEYNDIKIVVSTVGLYSPRSNQDGEVSAIGADNRIFETMAFHANDDERYWDADVSRQIYFESNWAICEEDADDKANQMHERVVDEISEQLSKGNQYTVYA